VSSPSCAARICVAGRCILDLRNLSVHQQTGLKTLRGIIAEQQRLLQALQVAAQQGAAGQVHLFYQSHESTA